MVLNACFQQSHPRYTGMLAQVHPTPCDELYKCTKPCEATDYRWALFILFIGPSLMAWDTMTVADKSVP